MQYFVRFLAPGSEETDNGWVFLCLTVYISQNKIAAKGRFMAL